MNSKVAGFTQNPPDIYCEGNFKGFVLTGVKPHRYVFAKFASKKPNRAAPPKNISLFRQINTQYKFHATQV